MQKRPSEIPSLTASALPDINVVICFRTCLTLTKTKANFPFGNSARFGVESMRTLQWNDCAFSLGIDALFQWNAQWTAELQLI